MKIFVAALLSLAAGSIAVAQPANRVTNKALGIEVTAPAGWHALSAEANSENLRKVFEGRAELQQAIAQQASDPIVAFTKYAEPYPDLNPSFKVNVRPLGQLAGKNAREIISAILPTLKRTYADIKVEQEPMDVVVSGQPAAYARFTYTLIVGTDRFPTTSELWIVPRKSDFLMIGAGTRQDEASGTRGEIQSILATVRIEPQP